MNFDLSVVIPVYGVEKYVKACVDSVLNQTAKNIEVILVNDCTPDNSMKICEEAFGNNERVVLLNQPRNMGAGEARNTGIMKAKGKYIGFVDSDDQIRPDMFEKMLEEAAKYDADVVHNTGFVTTIPAEGDVMPVDMLDPDKTISFVTNVDINPHTELTVLDDDLEKRLEGWLAHKYHWAVWNQIYKRDFLLKNDIKFCEMKFAEDLIFALKVLFLAKCFVVVPNGWYIYRPSQTSITRSGNSFKSTIKAIESQLTGSRIMKDYLGNVPFFRDNQQNFRKVMTHMLFGLEEGYVRADYQKLGEEKMLADEALHEFFRKNFSDKAEYVEFLFYELLRNYPPYLNVVSGMYSDPKVWAVIRAKYKEYLQNGDRSVIWEGLKEYYGF